MARIYSNENFPLPVVEELRRLGHDVLTVAEAGKAGIAESDEAVMAYARKECRALLTLNRKHFVRLHHDNSNHSGIIVCSYDPDSVEQAQRIHSAIGEHIELGGRLVRVNRP